MNTYGRSKGGSLGMLLLGGVIGGAISLLLAPKKGSEVRTDIKNGTNDLLKKAADQGQKFSKQAESLADDLIKRAEKIYAMSKDYTSGKFSGTKESFDSEFRKLKSAFDTAVKTYKNHGVRQPETEQLVHDVFSEYENETLPKSEGMGRRNQDIRDKF